MTDLVTGEAVVLELRLAKLASRALALGIDLAVQFGLLFVGTIVVAGVADSADEALSAAIGLVFVLSVILGYPIAFETLSRGRTLGKLAFGLRVVREDGGPIRFRHALVRGLLGVVEFWMTFGSLALITSLASAKGKRVGDFLAGTVVVRERVPVHGQPVAAMPPQLAAWAAGLDLTRMPDDLALAARQFLARSGDLAPDVRASMGARLAASVAAATSPAPPPGVPPWAYLSAVLAERRRRELARLSPQHVQPPQWGPQPWGPPQAGPQRWGHAPAYGTQPPPAPPRPAPPAPTGPPADDNGFAPPG